MAGRTKKTAPPAPDCTPEQLRAVLSMRRAGASFDEIARTVKLRDADFARSLFDAAMLGVDTGFDRALEIARLDGILVGLYPAARAGDAAAAEKVLAISVRRERLSSMPARRTDAKALVRAYNRTVEAADKVNPKLDAALVEAGRMIARRVDEAQASGDPDQITKALYLLPHLNNTLAAMMATPKARMDAGIEDQSKQPSTKSAKVTQMKEAARRLGRSG